MGYLILGASGFLGSRILDFLEEKNKIVSIGTNSENLKNVENESYSNYHLLNDNDLDKIVSKFETVIDARN